MIHRVVVSHFEAWVASVVGRPRSRDEVRHVEPSDQLACPIGMKDLAVTPSAHFTTAALHIAGDYYTRKSRVARGPTAGLICGVSNRGLM